MMMTAGGRGQEAPAVQEGGARPAWPDKAIAGQLTRVFACGLFTDTYACMAAVRAAGSRPTAPTARQVGLGWVLLLSLISSPLAVSVPCAAHVRPTKLKGPT
jgi:hypothetical protein